MLSIINRISEVAASVTECFIITDFIIRFLGFKDKRHLFIKTLSMFSALYACSLLTNLVFDSFYMSEFIFWSVSILLSLVMLKGNIFVKIFTSCINMLIIMTVNGTVLALFSWFLNIRIHELAESTSIYRIMILFITKFVFFLVTRIILSLKNKMNYSFSKYEWELILLVFIITLITGNTVLRILVTNSFSKISAFITFSGIIAINIITYLLILKINKNYSQNSKYKLRALRLSELAKKVTDMKEQHKEMLETQNSYKNILDHGSELLRQGKYEEAEMYLSESADRYMSSAIKYIKTGSDTIDALINAKIAKCIESGIIINCHISGNIRKLPEIDLSILLSEILDNTIEKCRTQNTSQPCIDLTIKDNNDDFLYVILKSTVPHESSFMEAVIKSAKDIIEKYNGADSFQTEGSMLVFSIWLKVF